MTQKPYVVYILRCRNNTLYTGITTDLKRRIKEHNAGTASAYTRSKIPVVCVYNEPQRNRSLASKREAEIKKWSRAMKLKFIKSKNSRIGQPIY